MALKLNQKKAIVSGVTDLVKDASSVIAAYYRGLNVATMSDLRVKAREQGVYLRVVPNTLAKRALEGTEFACLQGELVGPLLLVFSKGEPNAAARLIRDFSEKHENLSVKAIALDGKLFSAKSLGAIADLPSHEKAISLLMFVLKAPISKFVRMLKSPQTRLVRTLMAIRDQRQMAV